MDRGEVPAARLGRPPPSRRPGSSRRRRPGVFLGANVDFFKYGFRKHPYASRQTLRAGYSIGLNGFRTEYEGEFAHTNSRKMRRLFVRVSNIENVRFHGFGNETTAEGDDDFYRTPQREYVLFPSFRFGLDAPVDLSIGPVGQVHAAGPRSPAGS